MSARAFPSPVTAKNASQTAHQHRLDQRSRHESVMLTRINKVLVAGFIHPAVLCGCICSSAGASSQDQTSPTHVSKMACVMQQVRSSNQSVTLKWIISLVFSAVERDVLNLSPLIKLPFRIPCLHIRAAANVLPSSSR